MTNTTNYEKELATLNSPVFTGEPKAPTQDLNSDSKNIATIGNLQNLGLNPIYFTVICKTSQQEKPIGKPTPVLLNEVITQNSNDFDITNNFYKVPKTGIYLLSAFIRYQTSIGNIGYPTLYIGFGKRNNSEIFEYIRSRFVNENSKLFNASISVFIKLEQNDEVQLKYELPETSGNITIASESQFFSGSFIG